LEVLRRLRLTDPTVPVVVITANAIKGQAESALECGATGFLTKPLDVTAFFDVVTDALGARDSAV
jgi:CheY-like chemotaxis protein